MTEEIRIPTPEEAYVNAIAAAKNRAVDADEYREKLNDIKERYMGESGPLLQELGKNMDIEALVLEFENSKLEKAA